jgi:hypothetical protein
MKHDDPIVYQIGNSRVRHAVRREAWERPGPVMSLCGRHCSPGFSLPPGTKVSCRRCLAELALTEPEPRGEKRP